MTTVERTGVIDAPPDRVWDVLADYGAIASWAPNVDHSCLLTGRLDGVGAVRRIQTGRATLQEVVETWEPGASLSYRIIGLPPIVRSVTNTWRLDGSGDSTLGRTRVTLTSEIDCGPRPPQQVIARVVGRRLAAASEQMIAGLTERCELAEGGPGRSAGDER